MNIRTRNSGIELLKKSKSMKEWMSFTLVILVGIPIWCLILLPSMIAYLVYIKICGRFCRKKAQKKTEQTTDANELTSVAENRTPRDQRKFDAVLFGATGFTGKLAAKYITRNYGLNYKLKWAIAGRSQSRLEDVKAMLCKINPCLADLEILIADSSSHEQLAQVCNQTKVIITTVGPYTEYGTPMVNCCAAYGTDYVDITGEEHWVREYTYKYEHLAKVTGARIVSFCGHDSIPWDISSYKLAQRLKEDKQESVKSIDFVDQIMSMVSGGTVATISNIIGDGIAGKKASHLSRPRVERQDDPYYTQIGNAKGTGFKTINKSTKMIFKHSEFGSWVGFFMMAGANGAIVGRSNAKLGYGNNMVYMDNMEGSFKSLFIKTFAIVAMVTALICKPIAAILFKFKILPNPGEGCSEYVQENGYLYVWGKAVGDKGSEVYSVYRNTKEDPGYKGTARMLVESGLCFVFGNKEDFNQKSGGMGTPASCFGDILLERLKETGTTFKIYSPKEGLEGDKIKAD